MGGCMDKAWNSAFCGLHPLAAAEILIHALVPCSGGGDSEPTAAEVVLPEFLTAHTRHRGHTDRACAAQGVGGILVGPFQRGCL